jgi:hypothetical protein
MLVESIDIAYVRAITGSSASGTFSESLRLSITYHYHQTASETFGSATQSFTLRKATMNQLG